MLQDGALTHGEWFAIWGESDAGTAERVYSRIKASLSLRCRSFWDQNLSATFGDNFIYSGSSGNGFRFGLWVMRNVLGWDIDAGRRRGFDAAFMRETLDEATLDRMGSLLADNVTLLAPIAGVPSAQLCEELFDARFWSRLLRKTFLAPDFNTTNYFYFGWLMGRYTSSCCPRILKPEHFQTLKRNAHRIRLHHADTLQTMGEYPDGHFTKFVLLDHQDWLTNVDIANTWNMIHRKSSQGALALFRAAGRDTLLTANPVFFAMRDHIRDVSAEAYPKDLVGTYLCTFVVSVPPDEGFARITRHYAARPLSRLQWARCAAARARRARRRWRGAPAPARR